MTTARTEQRSNEKGERGVIGSDGLFGIFLFGFSLGLFLAAMAIKEEQRRRRSMRRLPQERPAD